MGEGGIISLRKGKGSEGTGERHQHLTSHNSLPIRGGQTATEARNTNSNHHKRLPVRKHEP